MTQCIEHWACTDVALRTFVWSPHHSSMRFVGSIRTKEIHCPIRDSDIWLTFSDILQCLRQVQQQKSRRDSDIWLTFSDILQCLRQVQQQKSSIHGRVLELCHEAEILAKRWFKEATGNGIWKYMQFSDYSCFQTLSLMAITPKPKARATPNLQHIVRRIHSIGQGSQALPVMYSFMLVSLIMHGVWKLITYSNGLNDVLDIM